MIFSLLGFLLYAHLIAVPIQPLSSSNKKERSPQAVQGYTELFLGSKLREKELPTFNNPEGTLGYDSKHFDVPSSLRTRVDFWKKVYTEYTSYQAVLHDANDLSIIYGTVDFADIENDTGLSYAKKQNLINKKIQEEKKLLTTKFLQLDSYDNPLDIPSQFFSLFQLLDPSLGKNRFLYAATSIRAQVGQRDRIVSGFFHSGKYLPKMMSIFREMKIPQELTRLPLVESAFNVNARSKKAASGVWQFIPSTGRLFLKMDKVIDERNDPIEATYAAGELLRQNFEALGSWALAITAYNHGQEGMKKAVREIGSLELPKIIDEYKSSTFGFASMNFFSEFLAILEIEKEYRKHFGKLLVDAPIEYEEYKVSKPLKISEFCKKCSLTKEEFLEYNLGFKESIRNNILPIPTGYKVKIPKESFKKCSL